MEHQVSLTVLAICVSFLQISVLSQPTSTSAIASNPSNKPLGVSTTVGANLGAQVGGTAGLTTSGSPTTSVNKAVSATTTTLNNPTAATANNPTAVIATNSPTSSNTNKPPTVTTSKPLTSSTVVTANNPTAVIATNSPTSSNTNKPPTATTSKPPTSSVSPGVTSGVQGGGFGNFAAGISTTGSKNAEAVAAAAAKTANDLSKDSSVVMHGIAAGVTDASKGGANAGAVLSRLPSQVYFGEIMNGGGRAGDRYGFGFGTSGSGSGYGFGGTGEANNINRPGGRLSMDYLQRLFSLGPDQFRANQVPFVPDFGFGARGNGALSVNGFPTGSIQGQAGIV